jgi:hypothetical protein
LGTVRCGGLTRMNSNDLEGNTSALAETFAVVANTARVPFWLSPFFPQGVQKRRLQLWIVRCYSAPDPDHFRKFLSCESCGVGPVPKELAWVEVFVCLTASSV